LKISSEKKTEKFKKIDTSEANYVEQNRNVLLFVKERIEPKILEWKPKIIYEENWRDSREDIPQLELERDETLSQL
jgi:hypothetical protein